MLGMGVTELLIVVAIAVLLFGGPILTFVLGYVLGQKKAAQRPAIPEPLEPPKEHTPDE